MSAQVTVYSFAFGAGFVSASLIASMWELFTDEKLDLSSLTSLDMLSPIRGIVYALSRPVKLMGLASSLFLTDPFVSLAALILSFGLSFLQGAVVLTQIFGIH